MSPAVATPSISYLSPKTITPSGFSASNTLVSSVITVEIFSAIFSLFSEFIAIFIL